MFDPFQFRDETRALLKMTFREAGLDKEWDVQDLQLIVLKSKASDEAKLLAMTLLEAANLFRASPMIRAMLYQTSYESILLLLSEVAEEDRKAKDDFKDLLQM